jgi:hypothetical protein
MNRSQVLGKYTTLSKDEAAPANFIMFFIILIKRYKIMVSNKKILLQTF